MAAFTIGTRFFIGLGAAFLFFIFSSLLVSSLGFFFKVPITFYHGIISFILAAAGLFFYVRANFQKNIFRMFVLILFIAAILSWMALEIGGSFYDLSYDGQAYHQEMIIGLSQGWIPFYDRLTPESFPDLSYQRLLNSYPKAAEIIQTVIYELTGKIESAKGLNFIMLFMAAGFVLGFLLNLRKIPRAVAFIGTIFFIANPVFIAQAFSFYIDGQIYFAILSFGFLLAIYSLSGKKYYLVLALFVLAMLLNMKLIAAVSSSVLAAVFLVWVWIEKRILFKTSLIYLAGAGIAGVLIFGFNPYLTNLKWFGNPFYPAFGRNSINFVAANVPVTLFEKTSPERLFLSIFSKSEMRRGERAVHTLKIPFTYTKEEVESFRVTNNTLGGFGPLFGGSTLIILSIMAGALIVRNKKDVQVKKTFLLAAAGIFLSCIAIPISSYARYVPQLWAIAPLAMIYAFYLNKTVFKFMGAALAIILAWNVFLVADRYFNFNSELSRELSSDLAELKIISESKPLTVNFGDFRSNRVRFLEAGIEFREERNLSCPDKRRILSRTIPESLIYVCD